MLAWWACEGEERLLGRLSPNKMQGVGLGVRAYDAGLDQAWHIGSVGLGFRQN